MKKINLIIIIGIVLLLSSCSSKSDFKYEDAYYYKYYESGAELEEDVPRGVHFLMKRNILDLDTKNIDFKLEALIGNSAKDILPEKQFITYAFEITGISDIYVKFKCNDQVIGNYYYSNYKESTYYASLSSVNIDGKCESADEVEVEIGDETSLEKDTGNFTYYTYASEDDFAYETIKYNKFRVNPNIVIFLIVGALLLSFNLVYRNIYAKAINKKLSGDGKRFLPSVPLVMYLSIPIGLIIFIISLVAYDITSTDFKVNYIRVVDIPLTEEIVRTTTFEFDISDFEVESIFKVNSGEAAIDITSDLSVEDISSIKDNVGLIFDSHLGESVSSVKYFLSLDGGYLINLESDDYLVTIFVADDFGFYAINTYNLDGTSTIDFDSGFPDSLYSANLNTGIHPNFYKTGINVDEVMDIIITIILPN